MDDQTDQEPKSDEAPAAEWVPLDSLVPFEGNPRRNDRAIPVVASSIRRFGWGSVMVVRRRNRQIIAGHTRRGAARLLAEQWEKATTRERETWHPEAVRTATTGEVPVRWKDLDEHDSALLLVADNRIGEEFSDTDDDKLADLVRNLQADDVDLIDGTGLDDDAIKKLLDDTPEEELTGGDPGEDRYKNQFGCIVLCADEPEQQRVYDELKAAGYSVKVVTT